VLALRALGFGALTPFPLLVISALGIVVGALLTTVYLTVLQDGRLISGFESGMAK